MSPRRAVWPSADRVDSPCTLADRQLRSRVRDPRLTAGPRALPGKQCFAWLHVRSFMTGHPKLTPTYYVAAHCSVVCELGTWSTEDAAPQYSEKQQGHAAGAGRGSLSTSSAFDVRVLSLAFYAQVAP
jgi:hypothetical protein